ncbi:hypothetical protein AX16_003247 [Volvariella volvacea WC 439]|nr:hypothetical protein AX16_003247 [Volvariella volvacea WC 439]
MSSQSTTLIETELEDSLTPTQPTATSTSPEDDEPSSTPSASESETESQTEDSSFSEASTDSDTSTSSIVSLTSTEATPTLSSSSISATPTETPSEDSGGGLSGRQITIIVAVSIAGAIALLLLYFVVSGLLRRRRKTRINSFRPTSVVQFIEKGDTFRRSSYFETASGRAPLLAGSSSSRPYSDYSANGRDMEAGPSQPRPDSTNRSLSPPYPPYANNSNAAFSSTETIRGYNAAPMSTDPAPQSAAGSTVAVPLLPPPTTTSSAGQGSNITMPTPQMVAPYPQQQSSRTRSPPGPRAPVARDTVSDRSVYSQASASGGVAPLNVNRRASQQSISNRSLRQSPSRDNSYFVGQSAGGAPSTAAPAPAPAPVPAARIGEHGEFVIGSGRTSGRTSPQSILGGA